MTVEYAEDTRNVVEILSKSQCGFCMTGHHTSCVIKTTPYWGKVWVCPCGCDKELVVKPATDKTWFSKYRAPLDKIVEGDPKRKKRKAAATNIYDEYVPPKKTYVPPAPRHAGVDALASEMLEDVRSSEEYQAEKEKWSE